MSTIGVIMGSSRPGRNGDSITEWVLSLLPKKDGVTYELIDLREENLPMFDEVMPPMMQQYQNEHTKKWAAKIGGMQGFVVVSPEYNAGYPAVLKNAIDYLKAEWQNKPIMLVTYGWSGGASANNQLKEVFTRIETKFTETRPQMVFTQESFGEAGKLKASAEVFAQYADDVKKAGQELLELL